MEIMSFVSKDVQLQALQAKFVALGQLHKIVLNVCFPFDTCKKIQNMHNWGVLVTLVPNLPGETSFRCLSVGGLLASACCSTCVLILLLRARMTVVLRGKAELTHMYSSTIATTSVVPHIDVWGFCF